MKSEMRKGEVFLPWENWSPGDYVIFKKRGSRWPFDKLLVVDAHFKNKNSEKKVKGKILLVRDLVYRDNEPQGSLFELKMIGPRTIERGCYAGGTAWDVEVNSVQSLERTLQDLLILASYKVTLKEIKSWPPARREKIEKWAALVHLSASDNSVRVPPRPRFKHKTLNASDFKKQIRMLQWPNQDRCK